MDLARYVVEAVVLEGRSYREVASAHGVSKSYVGKLVGRFREGGYKAIEPRSRAAKRIPHRTPDALEDEIVALRKELAELGLDAGAQTIRYHLVCGTSRYLRSRRSGGFSGDGASSPRSPTSGPGARGSGSKQASQRVLAVRRDPLAPGRWRRGRDRELHRRPLACGGRLSGAGQRDRASGAAGLPERGARLGVPGRIAHRQRLRLHDLAPGRTQRDADRAARPWHRLPPFPSLPPPDLREGRAVPPDDEGLPRQAASGSIDRGAPDPGRSVRRLLQRGPAAPGYGAPALVVFEARDKARPAGPKIVVGAGVRVRQDRIDKHGRLTLRHRTKLHHIGIGARHRGKRVIMLVHDLDVRVLSTDGELLRVHPLDPTATTNRRDDVSRLRCPDTSVHDALRHHSGAPGRNRTSAHGLGNRCSIH